MMIPDQVIFGIPETNQLFRQYLTIHNSAGKITGKVRWDFNKKLVDMGWTSDEILVLVYETGEMELLNIYGEKVAYPNNLIESSGDIRIKDCEVFENMLILLFQDRNSHSFHHIRNLSSNYKPDLISDISIDPTCFKTIPERHSSSGNLEIFAGHPDGGLIVIMEHRVRRFTQIPFSGEDIAVVMSIALTANNVLLALLLENGDVIVLRSNLSEGIGRYSTYNETVPKQLVWCGADAVCLAFDGHITILGPNMMAQKDYDSMKEGVMCIPEIDGLKVITTENMEFWEKVPNSVQITSTIGSLSAPAMLVEAYETYSENSTSSGDSIRSLQHQDNLLEAVEHCIWAAQSEFDIDQQEKFLKAAGFGKTFLPPNTFDAKILVQTVKHLRVLNDIRKSNVARPLTYAQLAELRSNGELLIKRLSESHQHFLALQIAKYWGLRQDDIYVNWACNKLSDRSIDDMSMCDLIISKLQSCRTVNYTIIAQRAVDEGREELAISLLDYEPAVSRKVPLLLYMQKYTIALDRAIESCDPDLIYLVIMKIHEREHEQRNDPNYKPGNSILEQILSKPVARDLLLSYARQLDEDLLNQAFADLRLPQEAGHYAVQKAYQFKDMKHRLEFLRKAKDYYTRYQIDNIFSNAIREQLELIEKQKLLVRETGDRSMVDCSVVNTIYKLMKNGHNEKANSLAKKFAITEKKMMHIKLRVLSDLGEWDQIEAMTQGKKVPLITYLPFAETAIRKGEYDRAEGFLMKHTDPNAQVPLLTFIEKFKSAAEVAIRTKNYHLIDDIVQKSGNDPELTAFIDQTLPPNRR